MSERHLCLTCNQPLPGANLPCPNCAASASWPGLDSLILAQSAVGKYWYLARRDHRHLVALMDSWPAEDNPLRNLLARKLHRGIVVDGDHFLQDIVTLGARVGFRVHDETGHGVLTYPGQESRLPGDVSVGNEVRRPSSGNDRGAEAQLARIQ